MMDAGFRLNGLSKIYNSSSGTPLESDVQEATGIDIKLLPKERTKDSSRGNFLFRKLILKPDIKAGINFYEKMKNSL